MSTNVSGAGFPVTATLVAQTRLIASGATPSFHFLLVSHVTVDANGGLAVQFEHEQEVCRGAK